MLTPASSVLRVQMEYSSGTAMKVVVDQMSFYGLEKLHIAVKQRGNQGADQTKKDAQ